MSDSTSKRLEDRPTHSNADRSQTEIAALATVTGLSGDKANEYYHQVLDARGEKRDVDDGTHSPAANLGNTKVSRSGRKPKGSSGKNVEPIRVFEKEKDPRAFDDVKKAMADSPSTEVTALQVEMAPEDLVKAQLERSGTASGNRSFSDSITGVVYVARPEALEEELSHQLNPADAKNTTAENKRADKAQADALARAKRLGLGRDEAYYVFGKRGERVNAMAMAKHVVMRARKDLVPLLAEQGEGAVDAFVAEVEREMRADGRPDDIKPVLAVVRAYAKLSQMKPSEMTPEQREAWKDLSDASVWDQLAKTEKNRGPSADKEVMADIGGGTSEAVAKVVNAEELTNLESFDREISALPVVRINTGTYGEADRSRRAAEKKAHADQAAKDAELNRQARIRIMNSDIAQHQKEADARARAWKAEYLAGLSRQREATVQKPITPRPRKRDELQSMLDARETAVVSPFGGVQIMDGRGNMRKASASDMRSIQENRDLYRKLGVTQDAKGGDAGGEVTENAEIVNSGEAADTPVTNGPRIVVNPKVFRDSRDALCVAYNEAYRVAMEGLGFDPVSEPTDEQRRFFADTAYADDERMMRRTILARVCTFDTSVKNPTDEQIQESVEFLETVLEAGFPQNEREQSVVKRTLDVLRSVPQGRGDAVPAEEGAPEEGVPGEAGASGDGAPLDEPPG